MWNFEFENVFAARVENPYSGSIHWFKTGNIKEGVTVNFIDYEKAFDSVKQNLLKTYLRDLRFDWKDIRFSLLTPK